MMYDAAIIGAGVVGSMIARSLSMHDIRVCVIEAADDVAAGASRANSGIVHAGYDAVPGTMKAKVNNRGNAMMPQIAQELGVPYENCGSLVVAFSDDDDKHIKALYKRGVQNGVSVEILSREQVREKEPMLSDKVSSALYAKTAGIICPFTLTIAAMENAVENGAEVFLNSKVTAIARQSEGYEITAGQNTIRAKYVVNAAGVYADEISRMAGAGAFDIRPRKGEYIIFDPAMNAKANNVIFPCPTKLGKGVLFAPTVHGNMIAGPTAQDQEDKADTATSRRGIDAVLTGVRGFVPSVDKRSAITVFAGLRAVSPTHDFMIEHSKTANNFVNVAGIESPGLTSAPAIAEYVTELLHGIGLSDKKRSGAKRTREPIEVFSLASDARKKELIAQDPRYANVVCRCEYVTEAEIVASIRRPCGARSVDGVKFRTGAGMGRCHGGFCLPKVMAILARELGREYGQVTKSGDGAYILSRQTKEVAR